MPQNVRVTSPFDGHLIAELPMQGAAEIESYLQTATTLARTRPLNLNLPQRMAILEKAATLVEQRHEELSLKAAEEGGKPLLDSRIELTRAIQGIREAARAVSQVVGHEIPMGLNQASLNRLAFTIREPIGVVAAVSAFNHPFNLIVHQVAPAIAVGCPVIIKPATTTPVSCLNFVNILYEAGLPQDWCRVVLCNNEDAEKLVTDPRVAFFSFIGSAKVGWMLRSKLAPGTRCALEHGGAAPVIIDEHADIKEALPLLAKGGFYHAGQVCVSVQKIYVHKSMFEQVASGLEAIAKSLVVGDPTSPKTEVGPLITAREVDRVDAWVKEAKALGAKIITGGKKIGTSCYEPTVILNPPEQAKVSSQEIFGPVVCVYSYSDRQEAIDRANALPTAFQAAVFSKDLDTVLDTAKRLDASAVMVNDHTAFRVDWMPFGGRKSSGMGVGGILPSMLELTQEKLIVVKSKIL